MIYEMGWVAETVTTVAKRGHGESETVDCPAVAVVDDDESVRESLPDLLKELGFAARAFSSAEEFLASGCIDQIKCLILDISMPGMTGLELESRLRIQGHRTPIIFITSRGNESVRPKALAHGAVECLFKPFSDTALLEALNLSLQRN
ncbi:MAG: response regulator [Candidatus Korobacteraceae bacterium]